MAAAFRLLRNNWFTCLMNIFACSLQFLQFSAVDFASVDTESVPSSLVVLEGSAVVAILVTIAFVFAFHYFT